MFRTSPGTEAQRLFRVLVLLVPFALPNAAWSFSFSPDHPLGTATRWSAAGLSDRIQVGVAPGFATDLGATTPDEIAAVEQAVVGAFAAWESSVVQFNVTIVAPGVVEGAAAGFEIDLFAVPQTHPIFIANSLLGFTTVSASFNYKPYG